MTEIETEQLMDRLESEFTKMVQDNHRTIHTVCYFFSRNREDAEDLFQEILVNLWKGFGKFRGDSDVKTWIWRVSMNTCINQESKRKRSVQTVPLTLEIDLSDSSDEHENQVRILYERITGLPLFDRAIILLWLEGMKYDEIADIVGITPAAVTSRLFRIKEQLKSKK
jgi:RNA polymerase sigma-70 factor (ECF subfamily)